MKDWNMATLMVAATVLFGVIGYHMAEQEKLNDRLKRMEVMVAVCGDVANYFSPDEISEGIREELAADLKVKR
jgi:hypothetical protein